VLGFVHHPSVFLYLNHAISEVGSNFILVGGKNPTFLGSLVELVSDLDENVQAGTRPARGPSTVGFYPTT
jgi:hypothetical protein